MSGTAGTTDGWAAPPSTQMLRVLTVIDGLHLAGAEKLLVGLARRAPDLGIEVGVVSLEAPAGDANVVQDLVAAGARVWTVDACRLLDLGAFTRLARLVRHWRADVVHAHLRYSATIAPLAARIVGRPAISSFHHVPGPMPARARVKEGLSVAGALLGDGVLMVSQAQASAFERRYRLRPGSWPVLRNGIELEPFAAAEGLPADVASVVGSGPVVALVARLRDGKGHDDALDAWPQVLARVPDAHLLLVGDGPLTDDVARWVAERGLERSVTLAGARRDVPAIMAAADAVLLPSASEALPTVLIEAAAAGTPVVATRVGGAVEVVDDGRTGLLVPPGDPRALADALVELLTDPERRAAMGRAGRCRARQDFDAGRWAADLADAYRHVVRHGSAAA